MMRSLFGDLRGFDTRRPVALEEILGRFLRALGVPGLAFSGVSINGAPTSARPTAIYP